jgi:predicted nuclease with TOPRIM domain
MVSSPDKQLWLSVMSEAEKPAQIDRLDSIQDVERLLLEAANAIQRLIAERDALRRRVDTLETELARLRERTTLIHDSYRRLATEFVTQLQLLDDEINDSFREPTQSTGGRPAEQQPAEAATSNSPPIA